MQITVKKISTEDLLRKATETTVRAKGFKIDLFKFYHAEHSPIRTQLFEVYMENIPVAYSTHFIRHNVGINHWALTHRDDRGGDGDCTVHRLTPTTHLMLLNAQALINIARKRMCYKAHEMAREIMKMIHDGVRLVDPDLARVMVPDCYYRGMICHELRCCRKMTDVIHYLDETAPNLEYTW